jgi:hypothetical protein
LALIFGRKLGAKWFQLLDLLFLEDRNQSRRILIFTCRLPSSSSTVTDEVSSPVSF